MTGENQFHISPGERVAIVGSRAFPNPELVTGFVRALPPGTIVVSGGARGVDRWAEEAAAGRGLETRIFEADWEGLGRRAGPIRNAKIVAESDFLIAFWDGRSRGTLNAVLNGRDRGIPVEILGPSGEEIPLLSALVVAEETGVLDPWYRAHTKSGPTAGTCVDLLSYLWDPGVYWYDVGDGENEICGGPITEAGWYIHPYCHPMCCRPEGPFATREEAHSRTRQEYFDLKYPVAWRRGEQNEH